MCVCWCNDVNSEMSTCTYYTYTNTPPLPFSPDGQYVAAGSADGSVFVWDVASGRMKSKKEHT